jgi:hypothetical protein
MILHVNRKITLKNIWFVSLLSVDESVFGGLGELVHWESNYLETL